MSRVPLPVHFIGVTVDKDQDNLIFTVHYENLVQVAREEMRHRFFEEVCAQFARVMSQTYPIVIPDSEPYKLVHADAYTEFTNWLTEQSGLKLPTDAN